MADKFSKKLLSLFVKDQLPNFVIEDHPTFLDFLKTYYEYLEQEGKLLHETFSLEAYDDIDRTLDEFIIYFKQHYLKDIPAQYNGDLREIIRYSKDIYRGKGSKNAYRLMFRLLYDDEINFYFPKDDILRASDGKWQNERVTLRVDESTLSGAVDSVFDLKGKTIEQYDLVTGDLIASALVENILQFVVNQIVVTELMLTEKTGTFDCENNQPFYFSIVDPKDTTIDGVCSFAAVTITNAGSGYEVFETLTVTGDGINASAYVEQISSGSVDGFVINNAGADYEVGDTVIVDNTGSSGAGASLQVSAVDGSGGITDLEILSGGFGYKSAPSLDRIETTSGDNAAITLYGSNIGSVLSVRVRAPGVGYTTAPTVTFRNPADGDPTTLYTQATGTAQMLSEIVAPGKWTNDDGMLNERNFLQDSFYYQEFSYVIRSGQTLAQYGDWAKKLLHPSGQKLFGEIDVFTLLGQIIKSIDTYVETGIHESYDAANIFNEDALNALGMNFQELEQFQHLFPVWKQEPSGPTSNTGNKDYAAQKAPWTVNDLTIADTIVGFVLSVSSVVGDFEPDEDVAITNAGTFKVISWDSANAKLYIEQDPVLDDSSILDGESATGGTSGATATIDSHTIQRPFPVKMQWETNMINTIDVAYMLRYNLHYGSWRDEFIEWELEDDLLGDSEAADQLHEYIHDGDMSETHPLPGVNFVSNGFPT